MTEQFRFLGEEESSNEAKQQPAGNDLLALPAHFRLRLAGPRVLESENEDGEGGFVVQGAFPWERPRLIYFDD